MYQNLFYFHFAHSVRILQLNQIVQCLKDLYTLKLCKNFTTPMANRVVQLPPKGQKKKKKKKKRRRRKNEKWVSGFWGWSSDPQKPKTHFLAPATPDFFFLKKISF